MKDIKIVGPPHHAWYGGILIPIECIDHHGCQCIGFCSIQGNVICELIIQKDPNGFHYEPASRQGYKEWKRDYDRGSVCQETQES